MPKPATHYEFMTSDNTSRPRVAIVELVVPEYKVALFGHLYQEGLCELLMIHSKRGDSFGPPQVERELPFPSRTVKSLKVPLFGGVELHYQRALTELKRFGPDVVILQDGIRILSNYFIDRWCKSRGIGVIYYSHGRNRQRIEGSRLYEATVESWRERMLRGADGVIAYSEEVAGDLKRRGVSSAKVFVSFNTLDVATISRQVDRVSLAKMEEVRKELGVGGGHLVLYVGRLVKEKKPWLLLEAAHLAQKDRHPFHVVFIGDGPLAVKLNEMKDRLNLRDVRLLGHLPMDDVAVYLKLADIVCVPGITGLAVVHAFAAGRPYITCNVVGHGPEIGYLRDGENGQIVSKPSAADLASALASLLSDDTRRKRMGGRARTFALEQCSIEQQVRGFINAIRTVSGDSRLRSPGHC